ncbi:MAG TPA: hypothetical protein VHU80_09375 [Polyangiaceae bacterium]|jgi:hypothetical protein|nr:hypothetical protein [Polyangiaceae bacterium]
MTRFIIRLMQNAGRNTHAEIDAITATRSATYPVVVRGMSWVLLVLGAGAAALLAGYQIAHQTPLQGILMGVALLSLVMAMVAEFTRVRVEWTNDALSFGSPWAAPRSIPWDEVVEVTYSQAAGWFVVRGRQGTKIRLHHWLGGLGDLFDEMKLRASDTVRAQIEVVTPGLIGQSRAAKLRGA